MCESWGEAGDSEKWMTQGDDHHSSEETQPSPGPLGSQRNGFFPLLATRCHIRNVSIALIMAKRTLSCIFSATFWGTEPRT